MSIFTDVVNSILVNSIFLFLSFFVLLASSAYIGKFVFKKRHNESAIVDDETKVILGATLSLLGLLLGFILSISISGYNTRQQSQEVETIAIGNAYQRSELLSVNDQGKAKDILKQYLEARIQFFKSGVKDNDNQWRELSLDKQTQLWNIASLDAISNPNPVTVSVLSAYSDLYTSQQKTMASWRYQIPVAAWILLIFFSVSSNILIGYNIRGLHGSNMLMLVLPFLTTLALFMIAEIDIPGEGIIHVTPDDLEALKIAVFK
ncbi:hypothetical protein [Yersinia intermedia]|uniref:bestrophin-like domain n=1 Tax=Yersinia intermedia TaxID=631 RepID=UPI001F52EC74|nr:hypothetical protein [Yersinia intermedia]UNK21932.1 hypothetical protein MNQ97_13980 [Yersinia intermedia]